MKSENGEARRVAFLHPDLGLGGVDPGINDYILPLWFCKLLKNCANAGAERLVVDAAVGLAKRGHQVDVFTAFHDPSRCFEETVVGPFSVTVCGGWFPRHVFGKAHAFCAYIRCILVAICIAWAAFRRKRQYNVIVADQVSVVVPILHWLTSSQVTEKTATQVLFYCHHPDLLLAVRRPGLHQLYRMPLDWLEQVTTGQADLVLVNSEYTAEVFRKTFSRLYRKGITPGVLHPACEIPPLEQLIEMQLSWRTKLAPDLVDFLTGGAVFLSINRFERKKDIGLAIRALAGVLETGVGQRQRCRLVVAGGYDNRLAENREYLEELKHLTTALQVPVRFLPSFSDQQRSALLAACVALLYTPVNEHFGIVPLEAMAAGRPVVACNSGGPRESVLHGQTGFLCRPTPASFAAAMRSILESEEESRKLGENARKRVLEKFSRPAFGAKLDSIVQDMLNSR